MLEHHSYPFFELILLKVCVRGTGEVGLMAESSAVGFGLITLIVRVRLTNWTVIALIQPILGHFTLFGPCLAIFVGRINFKNIFRTLSYSLSTFIMKVKLYLFVSNLGPFWGVLCFFWVRGQVQKLS